MREHANLPAMMSLVRNHVTPHFRPNRPRSGPAVSVKVPDAAIRIAERFGQHLFTTSGTLRESGACLLQCALRTIELYWNLEMRSGQPHPLATDVVHVGEDSRDVAYVARRFGSPRARIKVFDQGLIHAIVNGKNPHGGYAEFYVDIRLTRRHGS